MLVAVDTGGTKTLVAVFGLDGSILARRIFPTPRDTDVYVTEVSAAIRELTQDKDLTLLSVALPSVIDDGVALWCPNLGWEQFDVRSALKKQFDVPIYVENDANLAGLAETRSLSPIPISSLYVTISTGIGTGVITDGKIDPGLRRSEGGHVLIEYDGVIRNWESFASGSAIRKAYDKQASDITSERTWHQIADRVSRGFLVLIPMLQPDIIIIGGGVGTHFEKFHTQLVGLLKEKLPSHIPCPPFVRASHPEEAVIYGCYYYALDQAVA